MFTLSASMNIHGQIQRGGGAGGPDPPPPENHKKYRFFLAIWVKATKRGFNVESSSAR